MLFLEEVAHLVFGVFLDEENLLFLLLVLRHVVLVLLDQHGRVDVRVEVLLVTWRSLFLVLVESLVLSRAALDLA